jgi:hypothetical protein
MRLGKGSLAAQFAAQAEFKFRGGRVPWKRTERFGNRPPPPKTLQRTGALKRAWTGRGSGSITIKSPNKVTIGVNTTLFPQAPVFQRLGLTIVRPDSSKPVTRGRTAMGWTLGLRFGAWISEARLKRGLAIEGRRLSVNPVMMSRAKKSLLGWIVTGENSTRGNA